MIEAALSMVCPFRVDTSIEYQLIEAEGVRQICQVATRERYPLCMGCQCALWDEELGCKRVNGIEE